MWEGDGIEEGGVEGEGEVLASECERVLTESLWVADIAEDNLLALALDVLCKLHQRTSYSVLRIDNAWVDCLCCEMKTS